MNIAKGHDERVKKLVLAIDKASYPRCQLVADMGLKQGSRYIFRHNYLMPAYEMGLVEMVYGNVPTKPEQVYRLTPKGLKFLEELNTPPSENKEKHNACSHNSIDCPCTKEGCSRHGKCCECVLHHKEHGKKLPACLRGIAIIANVCPLFRALSGFLFINCATPQVPRCFFYSLSHTFTHNCIFKVKFL